MTKINIGNYFIIGQDVKENPKGSEYIKIEDTKGNEIIYLDKEEFREDPELILGTLLGKLKDLEKENKYMIKLKDNFSTQKEYELYQQKIIAEGNRANTEEDLYHWSEIDWIIWNSGTEDLYEGGAVC